MASNLARAYPIEPTGLTLVPSVATVPAFSSDLFARFIDYTDRKATTVRGYVTCIRQFAKWLQAEGIQQPTRDDVKAYRDRLNASDLKAGTRAQYLRAVKHFFKWTASEGLYPNIAENIHGVKVRHDVHKRDALPDDAVSKVAESIDTTTEDGKRALAMYLLCVVNGTRCVELNRLNCEDIKTLGGVTYIYLHGKGHDEADQKEALIEPVAEAVRDYLNHRTEPVKAKSPLFTSTSNRNKGGRIAATTISTMLKRTLQGAGYDSDRLTAHSLRHNSGTGAHKAGIDLYGVQSLMRHVDPATSEIYIHDDDDEAAELTGRAAIYDYYFSGKTMQPVMPELQAAVSSLTQDEQAAVLSFIKSMRGANR